MPSARQLRGPLVDDAGQVVGVFATEPVTALGLAIPISALTRALQRQDFLANPSPC